MKTLFRSAWVGALLLAAVPAHAGTYFMIVAGLGGEPDYEQRFAATATELDRILKTSGGDIHVYTLIGADAIRPRLEQTLNLIARQARPEDGFVLILIGHGTFDGIEYKFNLVGPDVTANELAAWCDRVPARRQLIVNTTSASGGSIAALDRPGRAVIAATKSGTEKNATVFARYWVEALRDPTSDVNKDDATSALEAFEYAANKSALFYESQKRLATQEALTNVVKHARASRVDRDERGIVPFEFYIVTVRRCTESVCRSGQTQAAGEEGRIGTENRQA